MTEENKPRRSQDGERAVAAQQGASDRLSEIQHSLDTPAPDSADEKQPVSLEALDHKFEASMQPGQRNARLDISEIEEFNTAQRKPTPEDKVKTMPAIPPLQDHKKSDTPVHPGFKHHPKKTLRLLPLLVIILIALVVVIYVASTSHTDQPAQQASEEQRATDTRAALANKILDDARAEKARNEASGSVTDTTTDDRPASVVSNDNSTVDSWGPANSDAELPDSRASADNNDSTPVATQSDNNAADFWNPDAESELKQAKSDLIAERRRLTDAQTAADQMRRTSTRIQRDERQLRLLETSKPRVHKPSTQPVQHKRHITPKKQQSQGVVEFDVFGN